MFQLLNLKSFPVTADSQFLVRALPLAHLSNLLHLARPSSPPSLGHLPITPHLHACTLSTPASDALFYKTNSFPVLLFISSQNWSLLSSVPLA